MGKATFSFEIEADLKAAFSAVAEAEGRPVDDLLSDVIQSYLQTQTADEEYDSWFQRKVQAALDDPRPGIPNETVEAEFAAKRAAMLARLGGAGD